MTNGKVGERNFRIGNGFLVRSVIIYSCFGIGHQDWHHRPNAICAGTLSGGEQQMLAVGRALRSKPKLFCIDEPSTGLAPLLRAEVFQKIGEIFKLGITVLLVEQEVSTVFKMTSRNYVLSSGKIIAEGTGEQLLQDEVLRKTYLGLY